MSESVQEHTTHMIHFWLEHELRIVNTTLAKPTEKKATFRNIGTARDESIRRWRSTHGDRFAYEQIDYITCTHRWKNTVKHAESDTTANIDSDHYPAWAAIQIIFIRLLKWPKERHQLEKLFA